MAGAHGEVFDKVTEANELLNQDNSSRALEIYDDLLAIPGGLNKQVSKVVLTNRAESLSRLGQVDEALNTCEKVEAMELDDAEREHIGDISVNALLRKAVLADSEGDYEESIRIIKECFQKVDGNQEALNKILYNMGASLTGAGQLREAKDCYEQVVDLDPDSEEANAALVTTLYNIGVELLNQGDCEEACDWFEQVIERDPSHVDAQEGLVIAQYNQGVELLNHDQASEAVERFEMILENSEGGELHGSILDALVTAKYNFAVTALNDGNPFEAQDIFEEILEVKPDHAESLEGIDMAKFNIDAEGKVRQRSSSAAPEGLRKSLADRAELQMKRIAVKAEAINNAQAQAERAHDGAMVDGEGGAAGAAEGEAAAETAEISAEATAVEAEQKHKAAEVEKSQLLGEVAALDEGEEEVGLDTTGEWQQNLDQMMGPQTPSGQGGQAPKLASKRPEGGAAAAIQEDLPFVPEDEEANVEPPPTPLDGEGGSGGKKREFGSATSTTSSGSKGLDMNNAEDKALMDQYDDLEEDLPPEDLEQELMLVKYKLQMRHASMKEQLESAASPMTTGLAISYSLLQIYMEQLQEFTLADQEDIASTPPTDDSFSERKMRTSDYLTQDKNGNSKKDKFTFVDVAPAGFDHLRSACGMTIVDYLDSLCGLPLTGGAVGEGKSGQFFFFSADRTVMLKTVTHAEWQFMNRILKDYHHHMVDNIETTLLCRFYALYKLKLNKGVTRLVAMNNIFQCSPHTEAPASMKEMYDLKGSFHHRLVTDKQKASGVKVLKDLNWKNNQRKMRIAPQMHNVLSDSMRKDVDWLEEHHVMDYSMLLGISAYPEAEEAHRMSSATSTVSSASSYLSGVDPGRTSIWKHDMGGLKAIGEDEALEDENYYFGIIDILQEYNMKKKVEHAYKSRLMELKGKNPKDISAVNAKDYGERFVNFMQSEVIEDPSKLDPALCAAAETEREAREAAAARENLARESSERGSERVGSEAGEAADLPFMAES